MTQIRDAIDNADTDDSGGSERSSRGVKLQLDADTDVVQIAQLLVLLLIYMEVRR